MPFNLTYAFIKCKFDGDKEGGLYGNYILVEMNADKNGDDDDNDDDDDDNNKNTSIFVNNIFFLHTSCLSVYFPSCYLSMHLYWSTYSHHCVIIENIFVSSNTKKFNLYVVFQVIC